MDPPPPHVEDALPPTTHRRPKAHRGGPPLGRVTPTRTQGTRPTLQDPAAAELTQPIHRRVAHEQLPLLTHNDERTAARPPAQSRVGPRPPPATNAGLRTATATPPVHLALGVVRLGLDEHTGQRAAVRGTRPPPQLPGEPAPRLVPPTSDGTEKRRAGLPFTQPLLDAVRAAPPDPRRGIATTPQQEVQLKATVRHPPWPQGTDDVVHVFVRPLDAAAALLTALLGRVRPFPRTSHAGVGHT